MSIFRHRDQASSPSSSHGGSPESLSSPASSSSPAQRRRVTHIAPGTRVEGRLVGSTELFIEGEVEGEINVQAAVVVGADGVVKGPVMASTVRVGGRVEGTVQATDRVEVAPSGNLEGDIAAPRVIIAEGAFFKGRVEMRSGDKGQAPERPEKPPDRPEKPNGRNQQKP